MLFPLLTEEICLYGLSTDDVQILRDKEGVIVARVHFDNDTAILKYFEKDEFLREIENYEILQKIGVPTLKVIGKSNRSILLEDVDNSNIYRLGEEADFENTNVIKALAMWYKTLHTNGTSYVSQHGGGMYAEWDSFTLDNIIAIKEKFNLYDSDGIKLIEENFDEIRERLDNAPMTLTYNDFYYTNMVVKKDKSKAMMFDYNLLGKGFYASDIRNVIYWVSDEKKKTFILEYGEVDDNLMLLDEICAPIITLYSAMSRKILPDWAKEAIEDLEKIPALINLLEGS